MRMMALLFSFFFDLVMFTGEVTLAACTGVLSMVSQ